MTVPNDIDYLVEATVEGDEIAFGQFRVPLSPERVKAALSKA